MNIFFNITRSNFESHNSIVELCGQHYNVLRPGVLYPGVWGWDTAFHAIGLFYAFGLKRALEELEVLTLGQDDNGMVPHILFYDEKIAFEEYYPAPNIWQNYSAKNLPISGISQPPVLGFALNLILSLAKNQDVQKHETQIHKIFQATYNYHKWWYDERDPLDNGLVVSVHPWETGRDNACEWIPILNRTRETKEYLDFDFDPSVRKDIRINRKGQSTTAYRPKNDDYKMFTFILEKLKKNNYSLKDSQRNYKIDWPFLVCDVTINSFLHVSNYALSRLASRYGRAGQKQTIDQWTKKTSKSFSLLWNDQSGTYNAYDLHACSLTGISSNASFLPLLTDSISEARALSLMDTLEKWQKEFQLAYMVPSSLPFYSSYDPQCYWRGPVWTIMNAMIALGFYKCGERFENQKLIDFSKKMADESVTLIEEDGEFYEYHNPVTGEGCGAPDFGFTSVAYYICQDIKNGNYTFLSK